MRDFVRNLYFKIDKISLSRFDKLPFRALAVILTLRELRNEAGQVASGRAKSLTGDRDSQITMLRRDIHRIEKGLIMRPRRLPFGKAYVHTAVESFNQLKDSDVLPEADSLWATDVFSEFFNVTKENTDEWVVKARMDFLRRNQINDLPQKIPYFRNETLISTIDPVQFAILARQRRSVRWFTEDPIDIDVIDRALEVAAESPSACNRQNIRFELFHGTDLTRPVLDCAGGTRGFSHQVPTVAVVIGRLGGYRHAFDRHAIYIDGGLMSMSFLLALETAGLSACCINWPDVSSRNRAIKKFVHLDSDESVVMLVAIGHADQSGHIPASVKRSLLSFRKHNV
ncbi:hypothetical protein CH302_03175 [Rhodococcus sp. 15-2388-1-1a]|uniref:nitroreductase family protein n=1 Tax=Rhodococcus sp. 15-2388-1-1a TaxID=2023142 RepID=UPI00068CB716|nr:nitroreductase family protein [Rhodococcus sp. 15-2388-1-1a]OZF04418.1 hypothetical protein CH302_03175 [Rhodococcus sp. 15-2388-1-1a]